MAATASGGDEQAFPFRITVLEGELTQQVLQSGQAPGVLSLEGTALPYQGFTIGGTQRIKTTYYDGNPVATQQVIGPTEKNTSINGMWKDSKLRIAGGAMQLVALVDDIRQRGVTVRVTWGDTVDDTGTMGGATISRVGKIADTTFSFDRPQDVRWTVEFEWAGRDVPSVAPTVGVATPQQGFQDSVDALNDVDGAVTGFLESTTVKLLGLSDPVFDAMNQALAGLETATEAIDAANGAISYTAGVPAYVLQSIMASVQLGLDSLSNLKDTILGLKMTALVPVDDALQLLKMQDTIFQVLTYVGTAEDNMIATQNAAAAQVVPDTLATVRVAAGTDLRDLARQYYGDPDSWWAIAQYNDFPSSEVPAPPTGPSDDPALPVQIPRLQPGASSDLRGAC